MRRFAFVTRSAALVALTVLACTDGNELSNPSAPPLSTASILPGDILVGAGNIAKCTNNNDEATAQVLDGIPGTVVALGDNAFPNGRLVDYQTCYEPTWGRHKARTYAVMGNHEYDSSATADGAFDYFGARAGPRGLGYYSFDLGAWHIIVLNDNLGFVPIAVGSPQDQWLVNDLAANTRKCILAMWHTPLFLSSNSAGFTSNPSRRTLWNRLYAGGADIVLNGQQHHYERLAPMRPDGTRDDTSGIREFIVGTGGESLALPTVAIHPNSEARGAVYGVLQLGLQADRYSWQFVSIAGQTFSDSGSAPCNGAEPPPPPPPANQPPVANAGGPYRSEASVVFDGRASSDPDGDTLTYAWDFGDGTTGSGPQPAHTYATDGTYTVTLVVTDSRGAASAAAQTTATIANIAPSVSAGPDASTGPGVYTLQATFSDPGANDAPWSYTINWGDGLLTSGTKSSQGSITATHPYLLPGTYTVRVTVTDKDGGTAFDELVLTVRLLP